LYVLGCRGSWPVHGREFEEFGGATSSYLLKRGDYGIVLDCGSGLSMAGALLQDCGRVDILLTHIHYDHLIGLLSFGVFPRNARLRFFAQFDRWFGGGTLRRFMSPPFWPYTPDFGELCRVDSPGEAALYDGVRVLFHPACHPDGGSLLRLETEEGAVCAAFDNEHTEPLPKEIGADCALLLYDGMYTKEEYPSHAGWGHSYWQRGCEAAERLRAGRLLITHHAPDRTDAALLALEREAQAVLPSARFVRSGDWFNIRP